MSNKIVIVDYNTGNIGSIVNMIKYLGFNSKISNNIEDILDADKLIIPGVGNFDYGIKELNKLNLIPALNDSVIVKKTPVLGICLGAQLMTNSSEEGRDKGLGWFNAEVKKFKLTKNFKLPNIGWNNVQIMKNSSLFKYMYDNPRFYFVHSYHIVSNDLNDVLCRSNYIYDYDSALQKKNIYAVQFHPEKSHKFGMKIIENFIKEV